MNVRDLRSGSEKFTTVGLHDSVGEKATAVLHTIYITHIFPTIMEQVRVRKFYRN